MADRELHRLRGLGLGVLDTLVAAHFARCLRVLLQISVERRKLRVALLKGELDPEACWVAAVARFEGVAKGFELRRRQI